MAVTTKFGLEIIFIPFSVVSRLNQSDISFFDWPTQRGRMANSYPSYTAQPVLDIFQFLKN